MYGQEYVGCNYHEFELLGARAFAAGVHSHRHRGADGAARAPGCGVGRAPRSRSGSRHGRRHVLRRVRSVAHPRAPAVMVMGHVRPVPLLWCAAVALLVHVDRVVAEDFVDIDSMMEYIVNSSTTSGTPAVECGSASEVEMELCKSFLCACVLLRARRFSWLCKCRPFWCWAPGRSVAGDDKRGRDARARPYDT